MMRSLSSREYMSNSRSPRAVRSMTIGISGMVPHPIARRRIFRGFFPGLLAALVVTVSTVAVAVPALAMTSHAGWPSDQHLVMDKGPAGLHNTLVGRPDVHNYLLGGYGDDTIHGG